MKSEDRMRHFYVIGQTGTGKTTILQAMARQDVKLGHGLAVMDPHGDFAADMLPHIPRSQSGWCHLFLILVIPPVRWVSISSKPARSRREFIAQDANKMMIKLFGNEVFGPRIQGLFLEWCTHTHGVSCWRCTHRYRTSLHGWKFSRWSAVVLSRIRS